MARRRYPTIALHTESVSVAVPVPPRWLRGAEKRSARVAGFLDRLRYRFVADVEHTPYLHRIERATRLMEGEVVAAVEGALAVIELRMAEAESIGGAPVAAEVKVPDPSELASLSGQERQNWAQSVRSARNLNANLKAASARSEAAKRALPALKAEQRNLVIEGAAVRQLWREAYSEKAACYIRARSGIFGLKPVAQPQIAQYRFADGPHLDENGELTR